MRARFGAWYCDVCGGLLLPVRGEQIHQRQLPDGRRLDLDEPCLPLFEAAAGDYRRLPAGPLRTYLADRPAVLDLPPSDDAAA